MRFLVTLTISKDAGN